MVAMAKEEVSVFYIRVLKRFIEKLDLANLRLAYHFVRCLKVEE